MAEVQLTAQTRRTSSRITSPIPLLAFLGALVESVVGTLAYGLNSQGAPLSLVVALCVATIGLPLVLIAAIHNLITRHHHKLYAPADYRNPDDFVRILETERDTIESVGRRNLAGNYQPFILSAVTDKRELAAVAARIKAWQPILDAMDADEFVALHSWYNEQGDHHHALVALDIALSKGRITSKNLGFRSASLRKLGRLAEGESSARLALELDPNNADAHYNLAKIYAAMGVRDRALAVYAMNDERGWC